MCCDWASPVLEIRVKPQESKTIWDQAVPAQYKTES
jgi:hypothetical protein